MAIVMTIFVVRRNADMTEGRGPMVTDKAFATAHEASRYIESKGSYDRSFYDVEALPVYDVAPNPVDEIRERAMKKLSHEEKMALGLLK